jgi:uncharacterized NAD(P)/FAD-binding protein YdhS
MPENAFDVAIVGAGLTGSLLAIQLLRQMPAGSSVALIGKAGETGMGLAYGTRNPVHLLNVRAGRMSLDAEDEGDFASWLAAAHPELEGPQGFTETYAPRGTYGEYVRIRLAEAVAEMRGRIYLAMFTGEVMGLERDGEEYVLELATGDTIGARQVCLCLGNAPSRLPLAADKVDAAVRPRIVEDPWRDRRMAQIGPEARLLFVGTGLTMIDQVLARRRAGHRGPMLALSRRGLLPAAHRQTSSAPATWEPPANNGRLSVLFRAIREAARAAEDGGGDWRAVIDGLRPATQRLWQRLTPASRRRFLRHAEAYWSAHRHRMAPAVAEQIAALQTSGDLTVLAGRVDRIGRAGKALGVVVQPRGRGYAEAIAADWVINCTGPGRLAAPAASALVADLLAHGLARGDPLGLGLDVSRDGELIGRGRRHMPGLYALGSAGRGRFLEITAAREIRDQAVAVAARIAAAKLSELFPRGRARRATPEWQEHAD